MTTTPPLDLVEAAKAFVAYDPAMEYSVSSAVVFCRVENRLRRAVAALPKDAVVVPLSLLNEIQACLDSDYPLVGDQLRVHLTGRQGENGGGEDKPWQCSHCGGKDMYFDRCLDADNMMHDRCSNCGNVVS